jgi:hypothetical protein
MPYESRAQQGLFHSKNSPVSPDVVKEFDAASKGQHGLPEHKKAGKAKPGSPEHRRKHIGKAIKKAHEEYQSKYGSPSPERPPAMNNDMPINPNNSVRM